MKNNKSLLAVVDPEPNSTIMIYDVHASESGALSILNDFYRQVKNYWDKSIKWVFIVSTPYYNETENIVVHRFPWVKKNWVYRLYFDTVITRMILKRYKPDKVFSLQNKGISFYFNKQLVYLHLPFILTDHKFNILIEEKKLWLYQNILSKSIFRSLRKVDYTIVQTRWMKDALIKKGRLDERKIIVLEPDITCNHIGVFKDTIESRKTFFYPATAFSYKNHMTMLKALNYAQDRGLNDYKVILTIRPNENKLAKKLSNFSQKYNLNVEFVGTISREEVFRLYSTSILLFPSYVESFGLPLLEARKSGTYIIASDCSFSREILDGYDRAYFFSELDYKNMGEIVLNLSGQRRKG